MIEMIVSLSSTVEFNPRNLKRTINLLQLLSEIGKIRPIDESDPKSPTLDKWGFGQGLHWRVFCEKSVLWIFLCQNFLFRMTLFLQILLDFEQKCQFNSNEKEANCQKKKTYKYNKTSLNLKNCSLSSLNGEPMDVDDMTIKDFYMEHVDKYVHAFRKSNKLARRDKDPEQFNLLLQLTLGVGSTKSDITCADVLGPKYSTFLDKSPLFGVVDVEARNTLFALRTFSFMDPALSSEVLS